MPTNFLAQTESASHYYGIAIKRMTAVMALMNYSAPNQLVHPATSCVQLLALVFHNDGSAMGTTIVGIVLMSQQISAGLNHPMHAATVNSCAAVGTASTSHGNVMETKIVLMALMRISQNVVG